LIKDAGRDDGKVAAGPSLLLPLLDGGIVGIVLGNGGRSELGGRHGLVLHGKC
jgi:hypothetical protein